MDSSRIHRTAFKFGSFNSSSYGEMLLAPDGRIKVYNHPNEHRFRFDGDVLEFLSVSGVVTSRVKWHGEIGAFLPLDRTRHFLWPLLSLEPPVPVARTARIIVNTVPKAGTYLLEEVLTQLGFRSIHLHLNHNGLYDDRGVPSEELHFDPGDRFVPCPPRAVAELLAPGEFAVGHIDSKPELDAIRAAGVHVIGSIRDLREVAVSFYRFKRDKVKATRPADHVIKSLDPRAGFLAYLVQSAEDELPSFMRLTRLLREDPCCLLRFEEITSGQLSQRSRDGLDAIEPGLAAAFVEALTAALGRPTSTFSGQLSLADEFDWPEARQIYEAVGYLEANREAGYL